MTIKILELFNFEGYEATTFEFDDGVNTITGLSGHGKSSIVRGLRWALENNPPGESMISHFAKGDTIAAIGFSDSSYIVRTRGTRGINKYEVSTYDKPFKALKRGKVPDEVKSISNMGTTNIQRQKDFYFMLNDSPGQVAKMFNKVSGLEEVTQAQAEINSRYKSTKRKKEAEVVRQKNLKRKLDSVLWAQKADEEYSVIETDRETLSALGREILEVENTLTSIDDINKDISELPDPAIIETIDKIFEVEDGVGELEDDIDNIKNLLESIVQVENEIKDINLPDSNRIDEIEAVLSEIQAMDDTLREVNDLIQYIAIYQADIADADFELMTLQNEYDKTLKKLGVCPTCGGKV